MATTPVEQLTYPYPLRLGQVAPDGDIFTTSLMQAIHQLAYYVHEDINDVSTEVPTFIGPNFMAEVAMPGLSFWVAYGNGVFVATDNDTGLNVFVTTNSGASWTTYAITAHGAGSWGTISYGNTRFLTVGDSYHGYVSVSADNGATWTDHIVAAGAEYWRYGTYGGGSWILVGNGASKAAYSTDDGATWTLSGALPGGAGNWYRVGYNSVSATFMTVVNSSTRAAKSTDAGHTWSSITMPSSRQWSSIVCNDGIWMAVSDVVNKVAISIDDGANWTEYTAPFQGLYCSEICYARGVWYVVTTTGVSGTSSIWLSRDTGANWNEVVLTTTRETNGLAINDNTLVAVSSDGYSFTARNEKLCA